MNLIFIYGPPAVGKLTVAEELAKITNYRVFHNHLTQDLASEIYPDFCKNKFKLAEAIRLEVFEFAAKNNTDLIFTHVYASGDEDDSFVSSVIDIIKKYNGSIHLVQLTAPRDVLYSRVGNESRKRFKKAHDRETLEWKLDEFELEGALDVSNAIVVDTSLQDADLSANQIVEYFKL